MKNILLIGVGGTGSTAVDIFFQKKEELGNQTGNNVTALVFDTDAGDIADIKAATPVVMADPASVGTICDRVGKEYLREWFPCDSKMIRAQEMVRGASQWRKKSFLAFLNLMNKPASRAAFTGALEKMAVDPNASCEIYVVASLAGGTGSGSFIPIALYAKRYLRKMLGKDPIVNAMLAMPDIYADAQTPENRIKVYANAYAIIRELNAINLVARNYNEGRTTRKKAPIRIRIGHPDEPNVGILFDASDKSFWTPEAAPFSQIFLLDRVPGLHTPDAHNIVLANSLYTIICTEIGAKFDSEASNHETVRSQNNGSNAVYASVSTSQIRFPKDTILDYLAHKKAVDSCEKEWMVLYKETEKKIHEKEQQAKDCNRRYTMKDGEYAELFIEAYENLAGPPTRELSTLDIVERGTTKSNTENNGESISYGYAKAYWEKILLDLQNCIEKAKGFEPVSTDEKITKEMVIAAGEDYKHMLDKYFKACVAKIRGTRTSKVDSYLTFDIEKKVFEDGSIVKELLMKDKKFIHPVAAMINLCYLKKEIAKFVSGWTEQSEWPELKTRGSISLPNSFLVFSQGGASKNTTDVEVKIEKSGYMKGEKNRFLNLVTKPQEYEKNKTNPKADLICVTNDAQALLMNIRIKATEQLSNIVLCALSKRIDLLIEKYRTFFTRFEKEKSEVSDAMTLVYHRDCGIVDSIINVFSTKEGKDEILNKVFNESGPETDADVAESDNVSGKGVFEAVYKAAVASVERDKNWNDKDTSAYRSLFSTLVSSFRTHIAKSDAFQGVASYNVIQAVRESCSDTAFEREIRQVFSTAQELATPGLRINESSELGDLIIPSKITVFMMSRETGRYIKNNAEFFKLSIPADQTKEDDVIKACAGEFIRNYSGCEGARVSIVNSMPDHVLYCTGEIMDITPLRVEKINELSEDPVYFKYYRKAISYAKQYDSDMWNPHIGNGLEKRGNLPFLNEQMEEFCDRKMVKALLYAFSSGKILYKGGDGALLKDKYSFYYKSNASATPLKGPDGAIIGKKNIAQIFAWLRNLDETIIDEWSNNFDNEIKSQKDSLQNVTGTSSTELGTLETAITKLPFMKLLTVMLYEDTKAVKDDKIYNSADEKRGPNVFEFAYLVKISEESSRDCDDAERILNVAYSVFYDICSFRTNPAQKQDAFIQVYKKELCNVFEAFCKSISSNTKDYPGIVFSQLVEWINGAGVFLDINEKAPLDSFGNIEIKSEYRKYTDTVSSKTETKSEETAQA